MAFVLHPRLAADTHLLGAMPIADLLLMNDARFPWCILVPRLADARELHALPRDVRIALLDEVAQVAAVLEQQFNALKMNIAALGNLVPQLHVHIIARHAADAAWPAPVWGVGQATPYARAALQALRPRLVSAMGATLTPAPA